MKNVTWNVEIRKSYVDMTVTFDTAAEAEAFAKIMVEHYIPDEDQFSVKVSAQMAENVIAEPEEEEPDNEPEEPPDLEMGFDPYLGAYTNDC